MWALILSGLLVGATVSAAEPDAWSKGYLYRYEVKSKALTAVHEVANQFAGVQIEGKLDVQAINKSTVAVELDDFRIAEVHQNLTGGWDDEIPESQLSYQKLKLPSNVFYLNYTKGVISNITVSREVPLWFINWAKALASVFQLDIEGSNRIDGPVPGGDSDIYRTMEDVITGQCETQYVYAPLPKYAALSVDDLHPEIWKNEGKLYTVSKAVNLERCNKRAGYTWGLNTVARWEPVENSVGQSISRSSNAEAIISGSIEKYTIQKSVTTNRVILNPLLYNQQKGMLGSLVKVVLQKKIKSSKAVPQIPDPQTYDDLVYEYLKPAPVKSAGEAQGRRFSAQLSEESFEEAYRPRRHFKRAIWDESDSSSSSSSSSEEDRQIPEPDVLEPPFLPFTYPEKPEEKPEKIRIVGEIVDKIARQLQEPSGIPSSNALAQFKILDRELMGLDVRTLRQLANKFYAPYPENLHSYPQSVQFCRWVVFINALSQCGTGPALRIINEQIKLRKLGGRLAASAIGDIPRSTVYPNKPYLKEFFTTVRYTEPYSPENSTAVLAFSTLLRLAIVDRARAHNMYPVHVFGKLDKPSESDLQEYVKYLGNHLDNAARNDDSVRIQVYTRALGNIGHPYILKVLLPYILGEKEVSNFQRLLMVLALDRVCELYPERVRPLLIQIYQSTGETHQIRSTAVLLIMGSKPSASVLQRLAQFSKQDPNPHVVSVVKTAIQSAAKLTNPENEELARSAMAAVNMLSQNETAVQYSAKHLQDYVVREMALSYNLKYSQLGSKDSLIPNALYAGLKVNIGGLKHLVGEAQAAISSIQNLQHLLRYIVVEDHENEKLPRKDPIIDIITDLREPVEGQIAWNLLAHPSIVAFDNNTIYSWVDAIRKNVSKLQNGLPFNCTNIVSEVDVRFFFPNALGFPSVIAYETPVLYSLGGELRLKTSPKLSSAPKGHLAWPTVWNITADVRAVYSKRSSGSIYFSVNPLHKRYSAGYVKNQQVQVPVRVTVDIDVEGNGTYVKLQPIDKNHRYQLLHMSSIPYTAIYPFSPVEAAPLTVPGAEIVHSRKPRSWKAEYGRRSTGMVYSVEYSSEKSYDDMYDWYERYSKYDALSAVLFSQAEPQVYASNISVYYEPEKSSAKAVELKVHYDEELPPLLSRQQPAKSEESRSYEDQPEGKVESEEDMSYERESAEPSEEKYYRYKREPIYWGRSRRQGASENRAALSNANVNEPHKELAQRLQAQRPGNGYVVRSLLAELKFVEGKGASSMVAIVWSKSPVARKSQLLGYVNVKAAQAKTPYQVCVDAQSSIPNAPYMDLEKALKNNPNSSAYARLDAGEGSCLSGMKVEANLEIARSQSMYQYLQNSKLVAQCRSQMKEGNYILPACRNATIQASLLNFYSLLLNYRNVPEALNHFLYNAYTHLDYAQYYYGSRNIINGTGAPGKLSANLTVAPNMKSLNFTISSAYLDAYYENVRLALPVAKAIVSHPILPRAERVANYYTNWKYNATCSVDSSYIKTYDNLTYPFESKSPCWRILLTTARLRDAKPSPLIQSPNVTVMVREISGKKELRVRVGDDIVSIADESGKYMLRANSRAAVVSQSDVTVLDDKQGQPLVLAYALPDAARIEIADIIIHYQRERVLVQPGDIYRREVRGLCGTFDGQRQTDFKLPANCIVRNVTAFIESYTYGEKCAAPRRAPPKQCYPERIIPGNHTIPLPIAEPECVDLNNRVVLQGHKICISRKRLPLCKWECKAIDTVDKVVPFRCFERTDTIQTYVSQAKQGDYVDFHSIPLEGEDTKIEVSIATACERLEDPGSDSDEN